VKTVADELARRYGLRFDSSNFDLLERGLARQAATLGVSVEELCRKLTGWESLPALWQQTIEHVTVNETYLFRHPEQFQVLSKMLVPQRLFGGQRKLRAWSAGCSTGEEAYSLAMVLSQAAPHVEVSVLATDVSQTVLAVAQRGKYGPHSLREALPTGYSAFVHMSADGTLEIAPSLRRLVEFRQVNLADPEDLATVTGCFDFIFCRNVLIYFEALRGHDVLSALRDRLSEGGFLFLSALDQRQQVLGLEAQVFDGVPILCRSTVKRLPKTPGPLPALPPAPSMKALPAAQPVLRLPAHHVGSSDDRVSAIKACADRGDLSEAARLAQKLLQIERTPFLLHLAAMILSEQGKVTEAEQLLQEALQHKPDYVLGHLSLGLLERPPHQKWRSVEHLHTVVTLLAHRLDDEMLSGPEPLQVAMARRLARAGLANMERRS